ncbi:MAG: hypothetical protein WC524_01195 [Candidatus Aminicenantales bacterium]|nr:hypothetical protein [Acidobacteriota bacterium]
MNRKVMTAVLMVIFLCLIAGPSFTLDKDDYQVIKKAVQENPKTQPAGEAKWFKVLIVDKATGKEKVRVTLPISLVEIFARCAENEEIKMDGKNQNLNVEQLIEQLKKAGSMSIVEIDDEEATIKVWLE